MAVSSRVLAAAGAAVFLTSGLGAYWWLVARPVPLDRPDTVDAPSLDAALTPDPTLALSADTTDVLVVAVCTLRRDRMGAYGHDQPTTPFLDALADGGVLFEEHFTQAPWTRPAMGAIFTGRWPRVLKLDNPAEGKSFAAVVDDEHTLLAEALGEHGYTAVGAVANPNLKAMFGFAQGFSDYSEPDGTYKERPHIPSSDEVVDDLLSMAAEVPASQRLYARINVLDTHLQRKVKPRYHKLFRTGNANLDEYDAALRSIDAELARLYTELRAVRPNLLVVFVADHGEGLYHPEHHGPEHGNFVYRTTTQTPFIVHHPALPEPGRRIWGRSMNVDVVPTVLELLKLPALDTVDGKSQSDVVLGKSDRAVHTFAYSETFFRRTHKSTVYDGEHQLIREYTRPTERGPYSDHLFTAADWQANSDVFTEHTDAAAVLRDALTEWETEQLALSRQAPDARDEDVDANTNQMLRDLGYVDD